MPVAEDGEAGKAAALDAMTGPRATSTSSMEEDDRIIKKRPPGLPVWQLRYGQQFVAHWGFLMGKYMACNHRGARPADRQSGAGAWSGARLPCGWAGTTRDVSGSRRGCQGLSRHLCIHKGAAANSG